MRTPTTDFLAQSCAELISALGRAPTEAAANAAIDQVFARAEDTWRGRRTSLDYIRTAPPVACHAGCGWCCHQQVGLTSLEAIRIHAYLDDRPADDGAALRADVTRLAAQSRGMSTSKRAASGLACAFLGVDGNCRIYPVRPLRCRGLYSIDEQFCAASHRDPDGMRAKLDQGLLRPVFLSVPEAMFGSALQGVLAGMRRLKLAPLSLELSAAVAALAADARLAARWLAGQTPDRAVHLIPDKRR